MNSVVKSQPHFWDIINKIELPVVLFIQKVCKARELQIIHSRYQDFLGTKCFSIYCILLYSLGLESGLRLAKSIMFYSLLSAVSKFSFPRKRPLNYEGVFSNSFIASSSFPSRHLMAATIFADIFSNAFIRNYIIISMIFNRMISGAHFPSDTIAGLLVGKLSVYLSKRVSNQFVLAAVGLTGVFFWPKGSRTVGCAIPLLFAPAEWKCKPYSALFIIPFYLWLKHGREYLSSKKTNRFLMMIFEMISSALTIIICAHINIDFLFKKPEESTV